MRAPILGLSLCLASSGCDPETTPDEPADPAHQDFGDGKADGACLSAHEAVADGVIALVNDPSVGLAELDDPTWEGGAGLNLTAAQNILDARPFASIAELDAVPYVGQGTCRALATHACNVARRCTTSLDVMTWNIEHFPQGAAAEAGVVSVVAQLAPDVIGVQEIEDVAAFERVDEALPEHEGILGEEGGFSRVAVFYRPAAWQLVAVEDLFESDWYGLPRPPLAVTLRPHGSLDEVELTLVVVHLKAMPDESSRKRRRAGVQRLRTWIDQQRAAGDAEVIVVGDFNDELGDAAWENVFDAFSDPDADVTALTAPLEAAGEFTLVPFEGMLDHVFVTGELEDVLEPTQTEILHLDETWNGDFVGTVSDHRPVRSTFALPLRY